MVSARDFVQDNTIVEAVGGRMHIAGDAGSIVSTYDRDAAVEQAARQKSIPAAIGTLLLNVTACRM